MKQVWIAWYMDMEQFMTENDDCALDSNDINIIHNAIPISDERHIARWCGFSPLTLGITSA